MKTYIENTAIIIALIILFFVGISTSYDVVPDKGPLKFEEPPIKELSPPIKECPFCGAETPDNGCMSWLEHRICLYLCKDGHEFITLDDKIVPQRLDKYDE